MINLGIVIKKDEVWYAIIDGTNEDDARIISVNKNVFRSAQPLPDLMLDFYSIFNEIIEQFKPYAVSFKMYLNPKLKQIPYMHCSLGVLAYVCKLNDIATLTRSSSWITTGKKLEKCLEKFPDNDLKNEKLAAVMIAWYQFKE